MAYQQDGKWQTIIEEDCKSYQQWKRYPVAITCRYLRFTRISPGANIAEVVLYERSEAEKQAIQQAARRERVEAGRLFGKLPLVDEILCGQESKHLFKESEPGVSRVETILGRPCRVLPNEGETPPYFAYRMAQGKYLAPGQCYLLTVEYPDDQPRTIYMINQGCETPRGFHSGNTVGDALHPKYVGSNPESLQLPVSGEYQTWSMLFFMQDRFPDLNQPRGAGPRPLTPYDGFWVVVAQPDAANAPMSAGAAVARIRLFDVPEPEHYQARYQLPPAPLPRRHLFWREEMSDGVIQSSNEAERGIQTDVAFYEYKAKLMGFLGMNTFCKDLLEFGHNQGWDAGPNWYNQAHNPQRWQQILAMVSKYGYDVLPYYEYAGSIGPGGIGNQKRCKTLGGQPDYTHISWSEKANADVTDPDILKDAKKLLDYTIIRHKDKVNFIGAWFRPRSSAIPISFSDRCLKLFADVSNEGKPVTRVQLQQDDALLHGIINGGLGSARRFWWRCKII